MTISKGEPWGSTIDYPTGLPVAADDTAVASFVGDTLAVTGGDLWRVLGEPGPKSPGAGATAVPIDRLDVTISHADAVSRRKAVSHVRIGRWMSRRRFIVATNLGHWKRWNLAPRAHPNDGFIHVVCVRADMSLRERLIARKRALGGLHMPHPSIGIDRMTEVTLVRTGREPLFVDGRRVGRWSSVHISVLSDDLTVVI